jgi:hypothetical protein
VWKGWEGLDVWYCSCKSWHASFCITCSNSVFFHKIPMQQQTKHTQPIYHLKLKFNLSSSLNWHVSFNSVCTQTNIFFFKISSKLLTTSYLFWVHYYILCFFAKGQTKNLKGLRSKNNLPYLRCNTHHNLWCTTHR